MPLGIQRGGQPGPHPATAHDEHIHPIPPPGSLSTITRQGAFLRT
jgi:hypothetical protein